jgi:hypothetical protein
LRRAIATGRVDAAQVIVVCPWKARTMTIGLLLACQKQWGPARTGWLVRPLRLSPRERLGELSDGQRRALANALVSENTRLDETRCRAGR